MAVQRYARNTTMPSLCAHLVVFEILTRTPARDAARSKTVCKEWFALLSTLDFERVHTSRSMIAANQKTLMIRDDICCVQPINFHTCEPGQETYITCPFHHDAGYISILSHLDGLICAWAQDSHQLYLWNPTTTAYVNISTPDGMGFYVDLKDTVGLYKDPLHDYKVLHVTRKHESFDAYLYSRNLTSWRKIPFQAKMEYIKPIFVWSSGTQCGTTLYFTVCDLWTHGAHVVIGFNIALQEVTEICFPPVQTSTISMSHLLAVGDKLHLFITTGSHSMILDLWLLKENQWINLFSQPPIPPIPLSVWCTITHFLANGKWVVMSNSRKLYEIAAPMDGIKCFHAVTWFREHEGALLFETLVSPSI